METRWSVNSLHFDVIPGVAQNRIYNSSLWNPGGDPTETSHTFEVSFWWFRWTVVLSQRMKAKAP